LSQAFPKCLAQYFARLRHNLMFNPPLSLLRETVHPSICKVTSRLIKRSSTPAAVYRLFLHGESASDNGLPDTLVAKLIAPNWLDDAFGHVRETRFYAELLPHLNLAQPRVYYAGSEPGTANNLVIMEDVHATHWFPDPTHCWTMREIRPILKAYVQLHTQSTAVVPPPDRRNWLLPRHEERLRQTAAELPLMVDELVERGIWAPLPAFTGLLKSVLEATDHYELEPVTLLHNDVFPPNAALPNSADADVLLFDWEMLSWGIPEMDLAYMFLQPFGSHRHLDRETALTWYWQAYSQLGSGSTMPSQVQRMRQRYADSLWALWLIPVAQQMVKKPFPEHSFPRIYWDAMLAVLGDRLQELTGDIGDVVASG
jgi:hypothetical protein